ncbi:MAG: lactate racemase domain-containing protein, partial [Bacteroidia bacterium]|nr:lactate racemase domain-containing protein [Bacteroidia bacterium]
PVDSFTLNKIIRSHAKPAEKITVAIAVCDNTRSVPYNCDQEKNILDPILKRLESSGIIKENIKIIIGCGTHAATSQQWKKKAFGEKVFKNYHLIDHNCYSEDLILIGEVMGIPVKINKDFIQADIHIITGLVETHFMAGASGGRKAVCPGMVNIEATQVFHGPEFMANSNANNLVFEKNPCHEFALEVAKRVRIDFAVNVLLNGDHQICGIYTGELEESHKKAVEQLKHFSVVNIEKKYDIVLTHGGKGAVNHYQAIKGAWGTLPAFKKGGLLILLAHNQDDEPIGSQHYKDLMKKIMEGRLGSFYSLIRSQDWTFTHDQWEVQKWEQLFTKIGGFNQLIYCTVNIPPEILAGLPGISGYKFVGQSPQDIKTMLQNAIFYCVSQKKNPSMAFIKEGPYIVIKNKC